MLILGRKPGQGIILYDKNDVSIPDINIYLVSIKKNYSKIHGEYYFAKIGIEADNHVGIYRTEIKRERD